MRRQYYVNVDYIDTGRDEQHLVNANPISRAVLL